MHLIITIVYVLLLVMLFVFYYRPHLASMGNSIMRKHVMLFLIPTEVIANVESIQRYLKS
ncbi:hypothetical protein BCR44DRAFT_1259141 [Catenaria anguillulae PL171]|uniref:Uncharacterized protein n=1 Tax=Catenaria anguillulae PL171 TaxID=765915 RepID=A0A1Y2HBI4_9FUNG|nr:hypothetical protein BCR44DRAFT_1259141 [Catenaria anguillulae PL171]